MSGNDTMECWDVRRGLWPPERPRLAGDWVVKARKHVEACPACQEYFAQDRRLLAAYDRLRGIEAPPHVKEKVLAMLAAESSATESSLGSGARGPGSGTSDRRTGEPERRSRTARRVAVAGFAVAAGLAALFVVGDFGDDASGGPLASSGDHSSMYVEDYLRRAVSQHRITTSDPAEVERFLSQELGVRLTPLQIVGLELTGAEICLLEGLRGAMIRYRTDGETVTHYMLPREDAARRAPTLSVASAEEALGESPPAVVVWADGRTEQALVAPLPPERLLGLARGSDD